MVNATLALAPCSPCRTRHDHRLHKHPPCTTRALPRMRTHHAPSASPRLYTASCAPPTLQMHAVLRSDPSAWTTSSSSYMSAHPSSVPHCACIRTRYRATTAVSTAARPLAPCPPKAHAPWPPASTLASTLCSAHACATARDTDVHRNRFFCATRAPVPMQAIHPSRGRRLRVQPNESQRAARARAVRWRLQKCKRPRRARSRTGSFGVGEPVC
jgi:hypothetical protein